MADVTLTYKGSPILELSASGQKSINTQGTFCDANILLDYVKSGGGGASYMSGTYTPTSDVATDGSTTITNLSTLGFTPKAFVFGVKNRADLSGVQYAVLAAVYGDVNGKTMRGTIRYTNATNTMGGGVNGEDWTNNVSNYLWLSSANNINLHRNQNYILKANVEYVWYAWG